MNAFAFPSMRICLLHNRDHEHLDDDPGRAAREEVIRVAAALEDALRSCGATVEPLAVEGGSLSFVDRLRAYAPDVVVNVCESLAGDSRGEMAVPCLLDLLELPYTGSDALSLGLALHKPKAKELLRARGVPTPEFRVVEQVEDLVTIALPFPLIVKPAREDASVGVEFDSVVHNASELGKVVARVLRTFRQPALVEQYIEGREVYVPLLGNQPRRALPLSEIRFGAAYEGRPNIVSYGAKWDESSPEFQDSPSVLCELEPSVAARCVEVAQAAFKALGCRDYGRVDMRLSAAGEPYVIDINPNCDLHPEAGFAKAAKAAGIDYASLATRLVEIALERSHGNPSARAPRPGAPRRPSEPNRNVLTGRGHLRPRAHRPRARIE